VKVQWIIIASFLIIFLTPFIAIVLIARLKEKRSGISKIIELYLRLSRANRIFSDERKRNQWIERRSKINELPYDHRVFRFLKSKVNKIEIDGLEMFVLNQDISKSNKHVFYLCGGAYIQHPIMLHWLFLDKLAQKANISIFIPIYPKAPHHQLPHTYQKILMAYQHIKSLYPKEKIILMGDSAGGGLAIGFAQWLAKESIDPPFQLIVISPWLDLTLMNHDIQKYQSLDPMLEITGLQEIGRLWTGHDLKQDDVVSYIDGDLSQIPRIAIFVGTHEIFYPDVQRLLSKLAFCQVETVYFEGNHMNHVYPLLCIPEASQAISQIVKLINSRH